jgi:hypothetical protein
MDMDVIVTIMVKGIFSVGAMIEGVMFTIIVTGDLKVAEQRTLAAEEGEDDETYFDYCFVSRRVGYFTNKPSCSRVK